MRSLLPARQSDLDHVELAAALAYPSTGHAWLRANMVATVDGAGAGLDGRSASISGPPDRVVFSLLRALADVILVGSGTARTEGYAPYDVPSRWRHLRQDGQGPGLVTAVVSASLNLDLTAPLYADAQGRTIVITVASAPAAARARVAELVPVLVAGETTVAPRQAVAALAERGLPRIICEGGPRLLRSVVADDALDELCLTITPMLTGGDTQRILDGPPLAPTRSMRLTRLLEQDGFLFAGYTR